LAAAAASKRGTASRDWLDPHVGEKTMSFALYMIGFLLFLGGLAWGASVIGIPTLYIGIGALILLGIGIFSAVGRTRSKDPS
jgi:hypothetical protein